MFTEQIRVSQGLAGLISQQDLVCLWYDVCVCGGERYEIVGVLCAGEFFCIGGGIKQDCVVWRGPRSSNIEGW